MSVLLHALADANAKLNSELNLVLKKLKLSLYIKYHNGQVAETKLVGPQTDVVDVQIYL